MPLDLSFACPPYDRIMPLALGRVAPEGLRLNHLSLEVEEIFWRQLRHAEFDVSESSLSSYALLRSRGDDRFVAIPVFTSRFFRHACVFVNTHKGVRRPEDLKGRVVGLPEYQITAVVWLRGIFQDEYGVTPRDVHWRSGGEEEPGRAEKIPLNLPPDIDLKPIGPDQYLARMLDEGEIDALFTARAPSCFTNGSPNVARLFPDHPEVEARYFRKTGIFPIMHVIVVKREIYEKNPWIAVNLCRAFEQAKDLTLKGYAETAALRVSLPWIHAELDRTRRIMGDDWWPYGIPKNQKTLETFLRYHHEQGLSARRLTLEDLFAPETLDREFKI